VLDLEHKAMEEGTKVWMDEHGRARWTLRPLTTEEIAEHLRLALGGEDNGVIVANGLRIQISPLTSEKEIDRKY
jgi:hypothetical protein